MGDQVDNEEDNPDFGNSDSCYSDDLSLSSSYTESESESEANTLEETAVNSLAVMQQATYVGHSKQPPKRVRTRSGLANQATQKSVQNISTMLSSDIDMEDALTTASNIAITNAAASSSGDPKKTVSLRNDKPNMCKFTGSPGLQVQMNSKQPMDSFNLFLTDDLINIMVIETNRYTDQEINKQRPLRRGSHLNNWNAIDYEEMCEFLGIILHMGCVKLPIFEYYWSKNALYRFLVFSKAMPRNRFQLILQFWHFVNNENAGTGRLPKILPIVEHLINIMTGIYTPDKKVSIDKSLMLWRSCLISRQHIKNKRNKYDIILYKLCESDGVVMKTKIFW